MSDDPVQPEFAGILQLMAQSIDGMLNGKDTEPGVGFGLFVFDLSPARGPGTTVNYISNCDRQSMKKAMQEWVDRN